MQQKQHTSNDIKTIGFCNINDNEGEREIYDRQDRKEKTGVKWMNESIENVSENGHFEMSEQN